MPKAEINVIPLRTARYQRLCFWQLRQALIYLFTDVTLKHLHLQVKKQLDKYSNIPTKLQFKIPNINTL